MPGELKHQTIQTESTEINTHWFRHICVYLSDCAECPKYTYCTNRAEVLIKDNFVFVFPNLTLAILVWLKQCLDRGHVLNTL